MRRPNKYTQVTVGGIVMETSGRMGGLVPVTLYRKGKEIDKVTIPVSNMESSSLQACHIFRQVVDLWVKHTPTKEVAPYVEGGKKCKKKCGMCFSCIITKYLTNQCQGVECATAIEYLSYMKVTRRINESCASMAQ